MDHCRYSGGRTWAATGRRLPRICWTRWFISATWPARRSSLETAGPRPTVGLFVRCLSFYRSRGRCKELVNDYCSVILNSEQLSFDEIDDNDNGGIVTPNKNIYARSVDSLLQTWSLDTLPLGANLEISDDEQQSMAVVKGSAPLSISNVTFSALPTMEIRRSESGLS